jgi:V/A-type H+-transporting ATPase subunit A
MFPEPTRHTRVLKIVGHTIRVKAEGAAFGDAAIDPLISWSRYLVQLKDWFAENPGAEWVSDVKAMQKLLHQGDSIYQMMQVTDEEGISIEDYIVWHKTTLLDMVFLQQDVFDEVDESMPLTQQHESFQLI